MLDPVIQYCLLGSFALMFALSAADKHKDKQAFMQEISNYQLLPALLIPVLAVLIPLAEIITATLLVTAAYQYGAVIGIVLITAYGLAIWINLLRGRTHIDCGCLGSSGEGISYFHVLRNITLTGLLVLCLLPNQLRELIWLDYLVVALFVGASTLVFASLNQLLASHLNQRLWWQ